MTTHTEADREREYIYSSNLGLVRALTLRRVSTMINIHS
jgi:hypothetical protein